MEYIKPIYNYYLSRGDERVKTWMFMDTPNATCFFLLIYVLSIIVIKYFMSSRKPYELKWFLYIYNFFQVFASFYIFYEILIIAIKSKYDLICEPVNYSNDPLAVRMLSVLYFYYIIKLVDLIDTILFALRKKTNQITFLHVFHHSSMVINSWLGIKYVGGGQTFFLCLLNSFIHTIMYAYYGLSAVGPKIQKYLWWKKYLTQMQLIQFVFVMIHSIINLISDCSYPKGYSLAFIVYGIFITSLFLNFYKKSYSSTSKCVQHNDKKK